MAYASELKKYKDKDVIQLKAGRYTATIAPFLGSNIISMVDVENDINFFRKDESLSIEELKNSAEVYGVPTLLYPNRLRDGILKTSDAVYTFPIVDIEGNNALHGFLHKREHKNHCLEHRSPLYLCSVQYKKMHLFQRLSPCN